VINTFVQGLRRSGKERRAAPSAECMGMHGTHSPSTSENSIPTPFVWPTASELLNSWRNVPCALSFLLYTSCTCAGVKRSAVSERALACMRQGDRPLGTLPCPSNQCSTASSRARYHLLSHAIRTSDDPLRSRQITAMNNNAPSSCLPGDKHNPAHISSKFGMPAPPPPRASRKTDSLQVDAVKLPISPQTAAGAITGANAVLIEYQRAWFVCC
jgi:hypothetical protein